MKTRKVLQRRAVFALTPEEWDEKVNRALREIARHADPTITKDEVTDKGFLTIINYTLDDYDAEDAREKAELAGIHYTCDCCPHLVKVDDKRVKHLTCDRTDEYTRAERDACVWFYERMERSKK